MSDEANVTQQSIPGFERIALASFGAQLPVDTDHLLAKLDKGSLLLLNQRPQHYPWESHGVPERIIVIEGQVGIQAENGPALRAQLGDMLVIPAGLRHAYMPDSDGVVVVLFGGTAD
ncbi:MAG: cupin domain-containing protein [Burkholderiales bacterium]|nr:cupin domain-containing protein [Burkholderiales bacterium]